MPGPSEPATLAFLGAGSAVAASSRVSIHGRADLGHLGLHPSRNKRRADFARARHPLWRDAFQTKDELETRLGAKAVETLQCVSSVRGLCSCYSCMYWANISQNETTLDLFPIPSQGRVLLWAVRPEGAD